MHDLRGYHVPSVLLELGDQLITGASFKSDLNRLTSQRRQSQEALELLGFRAP
jgi:hypothetical protein